MKTPITCEQWTGLLARELPGETAHVRMAPESRGTAARSGEPIPAAVLALMYPKNGKTHLVFIRRNTYDGPHSAQVSFPGGAWEEEDRSLEDTALRETREELGITGGIRVLGSLTPLHIPVSNYRVHPFLGWMEVYPAFHPDRAEVRYLIEAPVEHLLDPSNIRSGTWEQDGRTITAPYYRIGKEKIWGATAMMLSEILQLAATMQAPRC
jgi:8-oxo-dGTP pyrophosphatase MutT (NUDIX family)